MAFQQPIHPWPARMQSFPPRIAQPGLLTSRLQVSLSSKALPVFTGCTPSSVPRTCSGATETSPVVHGTVPSNAKPSGFSLKAQLTPLVYTSPFASRGHVACTQKVGATASAPRVSLPAAQIFPCAPPSQFTLYPSASAACLQSPQRADFDLAPHGNAAIARTSSAITLVVTPPPACLTVGISPPSGSPVPMPRSSIASIGSSPAKSRSPVLPSSTRAPCRNTFTAVRPTPYPTRRHSSTERSPQASPTSGVSTATERIRLGRLSLPGEAAIKPVMLIHTARATRSISPHTVPPKAPEIQYRAVRPRALSAPNVLDVIAAPPRRATYSGTSLSPNPCVRKRRATVDAGSLTDLSLASNHFMAVASRDSACTALDKDCEGEGDQSENVSDGSPTSLRTAAIQTTDTGDCTLHVRALNGDHIPVYAGTADTVLDVRLHLANEKNVHPSQCVLIDNDGQMSPNRRADTIPEVAFCVVTSLPFLFVAFANPRPQVRKYDAHSGRFLQTFEGHEEAIRDIALAVEQLLLFTASEDGTCKQFNFENGRLLQTFVTNGVATTCMVSKKAKYLLVASDEVYQFDVTRGDLLRKFSSEGVVLSMALSACEQYLYAGTGGDDRSVRRFALHDEPDGEHEQSGRHRATHYGVVSHMVSHVLPSSSVEYLITASGDGNVRIYRAGNKTGLVCVKLINFGSPVRGLIVHEASIYVSGSYRVQRYSFDGVPERTFHLPDLAQRITVSPCGEYLYIVSNNSIAYFSTNTGNREEDAHRVKRSVVYEGEACALATF